MLLRAQWLGIRVGAGQELALRSRLAAVPFAFVATSVQGGAVDATRVAIGGNVVIDGQGRWVGDSTGLRGPEGPQGPPGPPGPAGGQGSPDTPEQVLARLVHVDGSDSGLDADRLDGGEADAYLNRTPAQIIGTVQGADGIGSGFDADLVDGLDSSKFMRVDRDTGTSGVLSADRLDIHANEIGGGARPWMTDCVRVGAGGSDNAYFGLKDEGANQADTVVAWGDDVGDDLRFIFTRSGGAANGEEHLRVTSRGRVGVGKPDPAHRLDGQNCREPVNGNVYISPGGNYHQHRTITGMCAGVGRGRHTIQSWIERCPGYGNHDCYTGWQSATWLLVEELDVER